LEPSATKGSFGAEPGIGLGELMNMCALATEMTAATARVDLAYCIVIRELNGDAKVRMRML